MYTSQGGLMKVGDLVRGKFGANPTGVIVESRFDGSFWQCFRVAWNGGSPLPPDFGWYAVDKLEIINKTLNKSQTSIV